jgi:hypothetical protein
MDEEKPKSLKTRQTNRSQWNTNKSQNTVGCFVGSGLEKHQLDVATVDPDG